MDLHQLATKIDIWAKELGFQQVGISDTDLSDYAEDVRQWIAENLHGSMGYMARNVEKRVHPELLHPGTVRVITARMNYLSSEKPPALPTDSGNAYIARFALGRDYHKTVRRRLVKLAGRINSRVEGRFRAFTDSAPVLEKPLAEKAGIGWIGKNTLILTEDAGSMFFLGEIYTNIPLPVSTKPTKDRCGACRACINVCPTGAIIGSKQLDARKCISYLTIESKDAIPISLRESIGNRVFGCDDCQLVCPWNRYATKSAESDFVPRHELDMASLEELLGWDEATFLTNTEGMALRRINYQQWVRNLAVAAGNAPHSKKLIALLRIRRMSVDDMVAEHIDWAITRQHQRSLEALE
jgi:epoxyqueuosine reductase